jgi:kynureninase
MQPPTVTIQGAEQTARRLDSEDPLAPFRQRFLIHDAGLIYLDGNSLGRLPRATIERLAQATTAEWGERLIRSWNEGWFTLPERVGAILARLLGAADDEVIAADSTSVNLFKLAVAALKARPGRTKIVTDDLNFPSDHYILQAACSLAGGEGRLHVVASADGLHGPVDGLAEAIDGHTALLALSHTAFKSSYTYDMGLLTEMAHRAGALALWDTSHSAGALPVELNAAGADLAVGCTYKYLNGGPGAPAFLYVRRGLQESLLNPIAGWMGQHRPFDFSLQYRPAAGLRHFLTGTPPILSLVGVEIGAQLLLEAGMERVRAKSLALSEFLIGLWKEWLAPLGYRLNTPAEPARRGSHVSLGHSEGWRINRALIEQLGVLPDFREPDNIRLGLAPLYNSFDEVCQAGMRLRAAVDQRLYEAYTAETPAVT